ncbi:MFS transporter [Candidatus Azobacteroides pseudotrichonymphae]|uniref:Glucose/galactose transporter n=1 Tax=Azobacteroides pseudotrichonymphae genomovar. CFP2 TaxID=511995 RepID=B6YQ53_AZOPC|nr:MFS transporter [Candidatus Azobacteroides pseudotrichonymphae]BAG83325.1 putative glucose/galactose transporter [Candidatus Azobacteroides pseudotrichonymphae genomovar. CFP2]
MSTEKKNSNVIAIIMMITLLGMIGFVTNLAAPVGTIWKNQYENSNFLGMLGNLMNFAAYAFIGIPAGKLLEKVGYKKTALCAIIVGFLGISIQFVSGKTNGNLGFIIYLLGAFVAGFSMCMLNTVANPMLNEMGGGGKKGSTLLQAGGVCNSCLATLAPILVGALIGEITKGTTFSNVNPVLFIGMSVFAFVGVVLYTVDIPEPAIDKKVGDISSKYSAWSFRHFVLGAVGIFVYVGIEVGIPGTMKFFLESREGGSLPPAAAGTVAGTYWFLMLIGRLFGTSIANKVSSKTLLAVASGIAIFLILTAISIADSEKIKMPVFTGSAFGLQGVPISALFLVLVGFCTSVMWGSIFNLAIEGLGKYVTTASGIYMMMVMGGGIIPLIQNGIVDLTDKNYMISYCLPLAGLVYLFYYALFGSKNVNKDIPV